ncbi:MAG: amidohydrolase family protein [Longimicrobiales bacterium]|nr:amidohydrolase family protein [Longimicrobiales bacterium]
MDTPKILAGLARALPPTPFLLGGALLAGPLAWSLPLTAQEPSDSTREEAESGLPLEPGRELTFQAREGTWMSVDVSPDGETLIFDLLGDLYTVPTGGGTATRLTSGMALDVQPRFSPDGTRVAFVSDRSGREQVWVLDLATGDTTQITEGRSADVLSPEWTPDGEYLVVPKSGRDASGLWLVHTDGGSGVRMHTDEGAFMTGPAFGPDDRYVWFAQREGRHEYNNELPIYQVMRYDRDAGIAQELTGRVGSGMRPAVSPDGRWLAYGSRHAGNTGLRIRELETGDERWLAYPIQRDDMESVAALDVLPGYAFTPGSDAVVLSYDGKIWRVAVDGSGQTEIPFQASVELPLGPRVSFEYDVETSPTFLARQIRDAVPSPDGGRLAFTALGDLYVMTWPAGEPRRIVDLDRAGVHQPSWSPDGQRLAFVSWDDGEGGHLHAVDADGGDRTRLTRVPSYFRETEWSPDGQRIVTIRAAARDVQENLGSFGGGLGTEIVWVPASGGDYTVVAPQDGRAGLHFVSESPDRIYASHRQRGLVSFRWDGTDEKSHLEVRGERPVRGGEPRRADRIWMAPRGDVALAEIGMDLWVVTVPRVGGETPTVSVSSPAFPATRLTSDVGGEFPVWESDGRGVRWSLANAHFVYDLDRMEAVRDSLEALREAADEESEEEEEAEEEDGSEGYEPEEYRIEVEYARDIPRGTVVLRGGRAITMNGDEIIEDADIVVTDDRIRAVGERGSVEIPAGAEVIDVSGKVVLPGYVDTHYHTQWLLTDVHHNQVWQYLTNLAFGVTTTQDVQTATTDILTSHDLVEAGEMVGPRIYHTGPGVFSGENIRGLDEAREVLERYKRYYGLDTFKMYMAGDRQQRQWLIQAARELELMPTTEGGVDFKLNLTHTIDGYPGLEHSLPVAPLFDDLIELYTTTQTTYTPTLLVAYGGPWAENYYYTTEDIFDDELLARWTPYNELESKGARRTRREGWFRWEEHVFYKHAEFLRDLVEAGGRIGVGGHGQLHGLGWHWELWAMASAGMDPHDALRAGTLLGAEAIGFGRELGSIEPGKLADLVVLDADPLVDLRNTRAVSHVMKNGRLWEAATLDTVWPEERSLPTYYWENREPDVPAGIPGGPRWVGEPTARR